MEDAGTDAADAGVGEIHADTAVDSLPPDDAAPDLADVILDVDTGDVVAPVAPAVEPEPVIIDQWLVAFSQDYQNDPVGDALEAGTFSPPQGPGTDGLGVEWSYQDSGENGSLGFAGYGVLEFDQRPTPRAGLKLQSMSKKPAARPPPSDHIR